MADVLYGGGNNIGSFADVASPGSDGSQLDTGDLRRKFNFGDRVSELSLSQDPFFRFVSMAAKKPTDDPQFKFTERRGSWNKRYAYPVAVYNTSSAWVETAALGDDLTAANFATFKIRMATDYNSSGNIQNIFGQTTGEITVGADGTAPGFYLPGQLIKINTAAAVPGSLAASAAADYAVIKITKVTAIAAAGTATTGATGANQCDMIELEGNVVKDAGTGQDSLTVPASFGGDSVAASSISSVLEQARSYVIGSSFDKGTGYPETWKDQPFSTGYGQTQIWKTSMVMDNTDRATVLKYQGNEWARIWKEKLIEHKWDIEQSLLFGSQNDTYRTTQGAVDWIINNGNLFTLPVATKTQDQFLDDMSSYLDPRYNNSKATVFFCSTAVYNWLHKLSGYFANNMGMVIPGSGNSSPDPDSGNSGNVSRADLAVTGRKKVLGLDTTTISTVYGDMNLVRNVHLDGTNVALLGINMKNCSYRPLAGNGINRDTSIYVGVQTLENSGVDRRVDQILTEAGMEWSMPEAHAIWTNS
jgi:hypothetical protein